MAGKFKGDAEALWKFVNALVRASGRAAFSSADFSFERAG